MMGWLQSGRDFNSTPLSIGNHSERLHSRKENFVISQMILCVCACEVGTLTLIVGEGVALPLVAIDAY